MTTLEMKEAVRYYCDQHQCADENDACALSLICQRYGTMCFADEKGVRDAYEVLETLGKEDTHMKSNQVDHPSHYNQGGIECIDAMESAFGKEAVKDFCLCNAFKYLWRSRNKNGLEDIQKAKWYLNKFKELEYGE